MKVRELASLLNTYALLHGDREVCGFWEGTYHEIDEQDIRAETLKGTVNQPYDEEELGPTEVIVIDVD